VIPGALRLLGCRPGDRVLDVGCGQGAFCRVLAAQGLDVTGLDASSELIAAARRRAEPAVSSARRFPPRTGAPAGKEPVPVRYEVMDAARLPEADWPPFDGISCLLALQNMDPFEPVLGGCARLLRPGGRLVLVLTHPAFRVARQSGWGWDEERKLQYRRVDHYLTPLKIPIQMHPGAAPGEVTWTFHRSLQDYVRALGAAGLVVSALEEWASDRMSEPGARARAENRSRREIPLFLALVALRACEGIPPVARPTG
jgi:SAM-dependent methyltransferase